MNKYVEIYKLLNRHFGWQARPLGTFALMQARRAINGAGMAADNVLFPGFADKQITKPVFVLGNPRSGTTLLHRFLLNAQELCGYQLWEMLFPSITSRRLLGPAVPLLDAVSPARFHGEDAHKTGLRDVETDDAMAFFHFLDGIFLWSYFLAWDDTWGSGECNKACELWHDDPQNTAKLFSYLEECWKRNLYLKGASRIAVKASSLTLRVHALIERYPDCKLLYVVRDPVATIPSGISLVAGVLERAYGMGKHTSEDDKLHYFENLYRASCEMFRYFHDEFVAGRIPQDRVRIVSYPRMMNDFANLMAELREFLEIDDSPLWRDAVEKQANRQRSHKSEHVYTPEQFGLTASRIRKDLSYVYDTFGLARDK